MIVLDDIERLLVRRHRPRFGNVVLQALLILLKRAAAGRKLLVIAPRPLPHVFEHMGLVSAFNVSLHCPLLTSTDVTTCCASWARSAHELGPAVALLDEVPIKSCSCCERRGTAVAARLRGGHPLDRWITCMEDLADRERVVGVLPRVFGLRAAIEL